MAGAVQDFAVHCHKKKMGTTVMEDVRKRSDGAGVKRDVDIPGDELSWAG